MNKLNENIKNFRTYKGITQQDLANKLGKSKSVISNWERGENSPSPEEVEIMCKFFQVTPNQIYGWEKNPEFEKYKEQVVKVEAQIEVLKGDRESLLRKIKDIDDKIAYETQKLRKFEMISEDGDID